MIHTDCKVWTKCLTQAAARTFVYILDDGLAHFILSQGPRRTEVHADATGLAPDLKNIDFCRFPAFLSRFYDVLPLSDMIRNFDFILKQTAPFVKPL